MLNLHATNNRIYNVRRGGPSDFYEYKKKKLQHHSLIYHYNLIFIYIIPPIKRR